MILAAEHISKAYTLKTLLTDATLYIEDGDKIGIIGINGTGKSWSVWKSRMRGLSPRAARCASGTFRRIRNSVPGQLCWKRSLTESVQMCVN